MQNNIYRVNVRYKRTDPKDGKEKNFNFWVLAERRGDRYYVRSNGEPLDKDMIVEVRELQE